jgi:hypothetical protein
MAGSIGVFGYQIWYYLLDGSWPVVPLKLVWTALFGEIPDTRWLGLGHVWNWLGGVPVIAAGVIAAYASFLLSDTLRRH